MLAVASLLSGPVADGQDYLGAAAVLSKVADQSAKPGGEKNKNSDQSKLKADIAAFQTNSASLAPADSAQRWLDLADRLAKLPPATGYNNSPDQSVGWVDLIGALPPPTDWAELAKAIAARPPKKGDDEIREIGLRLLSAALTGDKDARQRAVSDLQARAAKADMQSAFRMKNAIFMLSQATMAVSDDPDAILKSLDRQLNSGQMGFAPQVQVPNLVSIAGAAKAGDFLRRALKQRNVTLQFTSVNDTSRLAQKIALEMLATNGLGGPQWGLVNSLDSVDLYEAMDKHFGAQETNSSAGQEDGMTGMQAGFDAQKMQAQVYYFLGLISHGRTKDAVAVAKKLGGQGQLYMPEEAFAEMDRAGYTTALDDFFFELLTQDPGLPFWDQYVALAAKTGKTDRMMKLARTAAADADLSDKRKAAIHENLAKALLAADQLDEGVAELRALLAAGSPAADSSGMIAQTDPGSLGVSLARIGQLVQNPAWTEEGIKAAKAWLADDKNQAQDMWESPMVAESLAAILFELKRGPEAEAVLTDALTRTVRFDNSQPNYGGMMNGTAAQLLTELAMLYDKAGRSADVLALLEQAPYWNATDLNELFELKGGENRVALEWLHAPPATMSLPCIAARALAATGRKDEALKITQAVLDREPGLDRGYELLLQLDGTNVIPRLDELFARDQFEERPLIWKAHVLRQQGRLDDAEKAARQAIAIDPSDGEEGPGDRMRAYSELADILEERHANADAETYRGAVTAIRLSEQADQFYMAGLLKRAIGMYEQALTHFADAYCVQSRLAIQLSALGLNEQAEEHYRRAYELMPDSFGRVESHCFGCERAFDGERAQGIAEKVFTKIAAERPNKPQVHYLLGYLREEQEDFNAAASNYLAAVRLDPDYLNAWSRLQGIGVNLVMPAHERDETVFNIVRLDPLGRHSNPNFGQVTDLTALWKVAAVAASKGLPKTPPLLTLTASKAALENKKNPAQNRFGMTSDMNSISDERGKPVTPGGAVAETPFVKVAGQLFANDNSAMSDD